jgi:hypothetical protein
MIEKRSEINFLPVSVVETEKELHKTKGGAEISC